MSRSLATPIMTSSPLNNNKSHQLSYISAGIIGIVIFTLAFIHSCAMYLSYRHAQTHPKPINKRSGVRLQRYGPVVYAFMVYSSLAEVAVASWLLLQFHFNDNQPNPLTRIGVRFILFAASWTTLTGATCTLLFLHPSYSTHPIASIGAQALWILLTWFFWVIGSAVVNAALPVLLTGGSCFGLVYCGQMQALFAIAVLDIMTLTLGMLVLTWLACTLARGI